jgi:hypothetical protein
LVPFGLIIASGGYSLVVLVLGAIVGGGFAVYPLTVPETLDSRANPAGPAA